MSVARNQITAISPFWDGDVATWVFDDDAVGLTREPFVAGVPAIIDELLRRQLPDRRDNQSLHQPFRLLFSADPFPDALSRSYSAKNSAAPTTGLRSARAGSALPCFATSTLHPHGSMSAPRSWADLRNQARNGPREPPDDHCSSRKTGRAARLRATLAER